MLDGLAAAPDPVHRGAALGMILLAAPAPAGGSRMAAALYDPSPWVQAQGVEVLLARSDEAAARAALQAYVARPDTPPHLACGAAQRLAAHQPDPALAAVVADRRDALTRAWLRLPCTLTLEAMGAGGPGARDELEAALDEGALPLDVDFVRHLFRTAPPALDGALSRVPAAVEEVLLLPVALGLLERGASAADRPLAALATAPEAETRFALVLGLAELPGPGAAALLRQLSADSDPLVGETAALVLAHHAGPAPGALRAALGSAEHELRILALGLLAEAVCAAREAEGSRALERLWPEAVETALAAERADERAAGLALLARVGSPRDAGRAAPFLADEDPALQLAAAQVLIALAGPS